MDRNQSIGLALIMVILAVYFFLAPKPPQTNYKNPKTDKVAAKDNPISGSTAKTDAPAATASATDTAQMAANVAKFGELGALAMGTPKGFTLENELVRIKLNAAGARISQVELKKYKTYDKKPLILLDSASSQFSNTITTASGKKADLHALYYTGTVSSDGNGQSVTFRANAGNGQVIEHVYRLAADAYVVNYELRLNGPQLAKGPARIKWVDRVKRNEYDVVQSRTRSTINYMTADEETDKLAANEGDLETKVLEEPVKWIANKEKFFTAGLVGREPFANASLQSVAEKADSSVVKQFTSVLTIPASQLAKGTVGMDFYFGPNNYDILKKVAPEFDRNLDLGWGIFAFINKHVIINVFHFLEGFIGSYGIIIVLLVLFIKLILMPLTYKSYVSMAKMKVLKPEIDEIKARTNGDMQKSQAETMQLYSKMGVNPVSGCIPMLLSLPVLMAMFSFFPNSIELRQEPFLWANDLSTYDVFARLPFTIPFYGSHVSMFTLLMTLSTLAYTYFNNQMSTMQGPMKFYSYLMPVIFMFVLNSFPAGLSFYYFVSNIVTIGQQKLIQAFVDDKKIRAQLEANVEKNKDKKKSSFAQRLEEAMKANAERTQAAKQTPKPKK